MQAALAPALDATPMNPAEASAQLVELCRRIRCERPRESSSALKAPRVSRRPPPLRRYFAPGRRKSGEFDRAHWYSALIHFGPLQLMDAVDQIRREQPLPTAAARAIAGRFMGDGLDPRNRPIYEEFQRRKQGGERNWKGAY